MNHYSSFNPPEKYSDPLRLRTKINPIGSFFFLPCYFCMTKSVVKITAELDGKEIENFSVDFCRFCLVEKKAFLVVRRAARLHLRANGAKLFGETIR